MSVAKFFISYILVINVLFVITLPVQEAACSTDILLKIQQECGPAQKKLEVLIEKYDRQVPPEEVIEEMDGMFQNLTVSDYMRHRHPECLGVCVSGRS